MDLEKRVHQLITECAGYRGWVSNATRLDDLGFNSLDREGLSFDLLQEFDGEIPLDAPHEWRTIGDVVASAKKIPVATRESMLPG